MRRAVLIVMLDVMVLSVLALNAGKGSSRLLVPAHRWTQVIEEGLKKEAQMKASMAALREELSQAEAEAREAQALAKMTLDREAALRKAEEALRSRNEMTREQLEEAKRLAEEAASKKTLAEEQAQHQRELASAAKKREEEAKAREAEALAREREAAERKRQAEAQAEKAETLAREAEKRFSDAMARSREAQAIADAAEGRAEEAEQRIVEAKAAEKEATSLAAAEREASRELAARAASALATAKKAEESESHLRELSQSMQKQIREAVDRVELAMVREGAALERARLAEQERKRLDTEKREARERAGELQASLAAFEQKEQNAAERLAEARKRLEAYQERLARRADERTGSVWVKREKALRLLQLVMEEMGPGRSPYTRRRALFLPRVKVGDRVVVPAEFSTLGFGIWWYQSRVDRFVTRLAFALGPMPGDAAANADEQQTKLVRKPLMFSRREPRICLVPAAGAENGSALEVIGINALKAQRIQQALLFKHDAPDRRAKVEITPSVGRPLLVVRNAEAGAKTKIEVGDYLLTEDGRYVGAMVSETECYALPRELPYGDERINVPLTKPLGEKFYSDFVKALNGVRERVKEQSKRKGTRQ